MKRKKNQKKLAKKALKFYKDLLIKQKINIFKGIAHITNDTLKKSSKDAAGDLSSYTYHMADMASDLYEREFYLQLASGEREILFQIDDALKRIEEGTYGICLSCKKAIKKSRLKAIPQTSFCKNCQEKEESLKRAR